MAVRLILTHENADFDAVASMLALHKLDPAAIPVLPRRVNRNVRNFLTLYRGLMPVREAEDLRRQHVEQVYAVDTQTFNSVKGMRPDTPVHYIDHHLLDHELDAHERYEGEPLGANTTLLVERLREQGITVTGPEATLLLLGIYEDTGTLTYGTTTVRDVQAAAWLLERGAHLEKARQFLSYPLQDEQRPIYEELNDTARIRQIKGHAVLVATARTDQNVPEIAGLSQKLRDLYDPHALVMAVQMGSHVQIIGRSSVDEIDIGALARHFDGGGHTRAAAAIVRDAALDDVVAEIDDVLARLVQPSTRVRDIMSGGRIFTLTADTTVDQAVEQTRHISHEGYPVLDGGRVVGLLTRHALDRAHHHGLVNQPVADVMDVGQINVHPNDSLEHLRQQMMESGWGQMPVINDQGQLVGIVTRTDLIRLWNETTAPPRGGGLVLDRLRQSLPPDLWALVERVMEVAQAGEVGLYLVGGFVRDLLLDVPNLDIDFVVESSAIDFVTTLHDRLGGDMHQHAQFNTAKWLLGPEVAAQLGLGDVPDSWPEMIDFATARTEFYDEPTILPTVRQSSIKLDLHRRDFTINALAIRLSPPPAGELLDYYNGERDLRQGVIRVLHSLSFVDDPTRMIRAVRFAQRFGFEIEPRTAELFEAALPLLTRLSGDRLRNELNLIMAERQPLANLAQLDALGILREIHPALRVDEWFRGAGLALLHFRRHPAWALPADFDDWRVAMFGLLAARFNAEALDELGETLSISRRNLKHLHTVRRAYRQLLSFGPDTPPSTVHELLGEMDHVDWVMLWAAANQYHLRELVRRYVGQWRHIQPTYDGHRLIEEKGLQPGPQIGTILRTLHHAWLDGEVTTPQEEEAFVQQLIERLETGS